MIMDIYDQLDELDRQIDLELDLETQRRLREEEYLHPTEESAIQRYNNAWDEEITYWQQHLNGEG